MKSTILRSLIASSFFTTAILGCTEITTSENLRPTKPDSPRSGEDHSGLDTATEDGQSDFAPVEGSWVILENEMTSDGCGLSGFLDRGQPGATMDIDLLNKRDFEMIYGQGETYDTGGETVNCKLNPDQGFTCSPSKSTSDLPQNYGADATINIRILADGGFFSEEEMEVTNDVTLSCQGPDCGLVSFFLGTSFPCSMTMWSAAGAQ